LFESHFFYNAEARILNVNDVIHQQKNKRLIKKEGRKAIMLKQVNSFSNVECNWPCLLCDDWSHDFIH